MVQDHPYRAVGLAGAVLAAVTAGAVGWQVYQPTIPAGPPPTDTPPTDTPPTDTPQPATPTPASSAENTALWQLTARADALGEAGAADDAEYAELMATTRAHTACPVDAVPALINLLASLSWCTTIRSQFAEVVTPSTELAALYQRLIERHPNLTLPASAYRNWAEACLHAGDLKTLAQAVTSGLSVVDATDHLEAAQLNTFAARLHAQLGRLESADWFVEQATAAADACVTAARAATDPANAETPEIQAAQYCRANVAYAAADLALLAGDLDRATTALQALPRGRGLARLYGNMIAALRGDSTAEEWLAAACDHTEPPTSWTLFAAPKLIQLALARGDDDLAADRLEAWRSFVGKMKGDQKARWALQETELALRGRLPLDDRLRDDVRTDFAKMLAQWRNAPALAGGIGFLHLDDRSALVANLLRVENAMAPGGAGALLGLEHILASHAASCPDAAPVLAAAMRRELLGSDHGLLVYVPGRYTSVLLVCDANGVQLEELAAAPALRQVADALREAAEAVVARQPGASRALEKASTTAADALLPASVRTRVATWQRLTVSGAGMLQNVPLELSPLTFDGERKRLGTQLAIEYVANLAAATNTPPPRHNGQMLFAASLLSTQGGTKAHRMPEALTRTCLEPYAAQEPKPTPLIDRAALASRIVTELPHAGVAHLVGHGLVDLRRTWENGIAFGDDSREGVLWGEQVLGQDLRGLIVILSACGAGNAPWRRGGDPLAASLAGAMLASGARCVFVPITDVELERHLQAMALVHRHLATKQAPAMALLLARQTPAADEAAVVELMLVQIHGRGF